MSLMISESYSRKRWTKSQYRQFVSLGMIEEGAPYELIEGEVVQDLGQGRLHVFVAMRVFTEMIRLFGEAHVQSQAPVTVDEHNVPEPDVAVLRGPLSDYLEDDPGPADILLLIEVSNTTLHFDRSVKAAIYARNGIPEYWILDVNGRTLEVYTQPSPGGYGSITQLTEMDRVSPLAAPDAALLISGFLPNIA